MTDDALLVFLHVPKAGGTTINRILSEAGPGLAHMESVGEDADWLTVTSGLQWVSGHTPRDHVVSRLSPVAAVRPLRFFTCLREPVDHVRSHLNWLFEIRSRGDRFLNQHPPEVVAASGVIEARGASSPDAVIASLEEFPWLFQDRQTYVVIGSRRYQASISAGVTLKREEMSHELDNIHEIGSTSDIPGLMQRVLGRRTRPSTRRLNGGNYRFDPGVFASAPVLEFLSEYNALDFMLYDLSASPQKNLAKPT